MGSPISPLVANLFMEDFKARALSTSSIPPGSGLDMWTTSLLLTRQNTPNSSSCTLNTLPSCTVHSRGPQPTKIPPLLGHINSCRSQWLTGQHSLHKTHTHGPVSTLGQSSQHLNQIQCCQHPHT